MNEQLSWGLTALASIVVVFIILFIFHLIKSPAPKRKDANFVINCKDPRIISAQGLPVKDKMHWVQVHTYFKINYPIEIQTLALVVRGKPWKAFEWEPIMSNKMMNPRYHCFHIPIEVDLSKHEVELMASTNDEDYGSGKFYIKQ